MAGLLLESGDNVVPEQFSQSPVYSTHEMTTQERRLMTSQQIGSVAKLLFEHEVAEDRPVDDRFEPVLRA